MKVGIYISTVAFTGYTVEEMIDVAGANQFSIEFSSGMPFRGNMEEIYLAAPLQKKMVHNYFPAPFHPFVLNLASTDERIRRRSIDHCINGLRISRQSGAPFFAAHAGFCIDPVPEELGKPLNYSNDFIKNHNWALFHSSLREILNEATQLQADFLIENNVIAPFNLRNDQNPLLCCGSDDIVKLFSELQHPNLGLLLDTGHLKVSCNTLQLDLAEELQKIKPYISALHHSDNDGTADTNGKLTSDYWFLPYMKEFKDKVHVIEVKDLLVPEIHNHINLLKEYAVN
jgi:sugar phosphate isomerase/epimerase